MSHKEKKDIQVLVRFVHVFCREKHRKHDKRPFSVSLEEAALVIDNRIELCRDCSELLDYGIRKRFRCPHDPKPMCKKCETQCYSQKYKQRIREVMKFSGPYMIKRGRLDLLCHYLA